MKSELFEKWEHLIEGVDKECIPVEFIKKIVLKLRGRKQRTINIQNLFEQGLDPEEIEETLQSEIYGYGEHNIISVEFILDIEGIAETVQPETDNLLRGL